MVDFIKAYFIDKDEIQANFLKLNKGCSVKSLYDYNEKKWEYPIKANLDNMVIRFTKCKGSIENSIHKKFNCISGAGCQNYNDFCFCDLLDVLSRLEKETACKLNETSLTQLEFGFNIKINMNPTSALENNILMYQFKAPCVDPKNLINKKIKKFTYKNYEIKIYNKSLHYGLKSPNENILRIEVKYKSRKEFNKHGIFSLNDLKSPNNLNNLFFDFLKKFEDLLIVDSYEGCPEMSNDEKEFFIKCTHPNYWVDIRNNFHRNTRLNKVSKFKKLISKYDLDSLKSQIKGLLIEKFNELIKTDCCGEESVLEFKKCA